MKWRILAGQLARPVVAALLGAVVTAELLSNDVAQAVLALVDPVLKLFGL